MLNSTTYQQKQIIKENKTMTNKTETNIVTSSICISEDSIENIEQYGDTYTINFTPNITGVVSECKTA